ncbi:MAG: sporulation protein YunB [Clostridia bacterium]|nr:sporulation protein YunB [Clostridia bacterium]
MNRSSTMYHRLRYVKRRNSMRVHIAFRILCVLIILFLLGLYIEKTVFPALICACEVKAREMVAQAVSEALRAKLPEDTSYEELVCISRDAAGNILSIQVNYGRLNALSNEISEKISSKLEGFRTQSIDIPAGVLLGNRLFAGAGPLLKVRVLPIGRVYTEFQSKFSDEGEKKTRHIIVLNVRTAISLSAPMKLQRIEITQSIPIVETILVGSIPGAEIY